MKKFERRFFALTFFILIISTASATQETKLWYYNINHEKVILDGYDVVAYHTEGKAIPGDSKISANLEGIVYQFSTKENRSLFLSEPDKYVPAFGGWCTFLMGIEKSIFPPTRSKPDPENFKIIDSRLYLFGKNSQQNFREVFEENDSSKILSRAEKFWQSRKVLAKKTQSLPEGMNPDARMELLDWLPFMADWKCDLTWWADTTGENKLHYTGKWYFQFGYFGYCIQDDYMGDQDGNFSGTINGPGIRGYDPVNEEWHMTFIPVNQPRENTWLMRGEFIYDGLLEGQMETKDPYGNAIIQKVRFESISEEKFIWSAHWSYDGGETWLENVGYSICTKIREGEKP